MNIYRLKNICSCPKILHKFRSTHAAAKPETAIEILTKQDAKVSQNPTGITVASIENYSPITQVSVVIKAGSRYESPENLGIVHCLKNCSVLATKNHSAFAVVRNLDLRAAKIEVSSTRDHLIYTLQCNRDEIDTGMHFLSEIVTKPAFKHWEVDSVLYRTKLDLALLDNNPEAVLLENLHKAAFKGGLANSLYCPPFMLGKHSSESLHSFVNSNFTPGKTSIVGLGIDHENLGNAVEKLFNLETASSGSNNGESKFMGGEIRIERDIPYVHTAIVAEGSGLQNVKDALSLGVLQCLLGSNAYSKYGGTALSKIGSAAAKNTNNPFTVSSLNINYADTGIFGVYIAGVPGDMTEIVKSVVSQMREAAKSISESDVQKAKHQLKAKINLARDKSDDLLSKIAIDTAYFGKIRDLKEIEKSIDELKTSDISAIASKVMKAKPAMASIGRLHSTPYIEELI